MTRTSRTTRNPIWQLSRGADINARTGHGETFLFSTISRSWPSNESDLDRLRKNVVALIESTLCRACRVVRVVSSCAVVYFILQGAPIPGSAG